MYSDGGALSISPGGPLVATSANNGRYVSKQGTLYLNFAKALGRNDNGRIYDWNTKVVFALSVGECGELLDKYSVGFKFTHALGTKVMQLLPKEDGLGMRFDIAITDRDGNVSTVAVDVSWGELQVIRSLVEHSIPRLLGFDLPWKPVSNFTSDE